MKPSVPTMGHVMTTESALAAAPARPVRSHGPASRAAIAAVPVKEWTALVDGAAEANAFFDPA